MVLMPIAGTSVTVCWGPESKRCVACGFEGYLCDCPDELRKLAAARDRKRDVAALAMNMAISAAGRLAGRVVIGTRRRRPPLIITDG